MNAICLTHLSAPLQHSPKTVLFNLRLSTSFRLRHRFSTPSAPPVHSISLPIRSISPISAVGGGSGDGDGEGGGGFGGNSGGGDSGEDNDEVDPKDTGKGGMSMSQKLTLVYAALVGAGGVIGYVKSGSTKSAIAGGLSALILYIVYILLPVKPVLASFLGVGISGALLGVMGLRFRNSKKVFPAGVVSVASLIMVLGYFHGIVRSV
ncbi:hypothetical protein ZOSMA_136G00290 [Zostera marina]|uniref:Uncharacterized protein n=1 Tax=Zostera marina TaxID=29655 RepID=A0A0K9PYH2_ZOSMR|nr:hypothetical protein ZOSMA_136G00290 [Zostera marina]